MGNLDLLTEHLREEVLRRNSRVLILVSANYVDLLLEGMEGELAQGIRIEPIDSDAEIPTAILADAMLVVIEVRPDDDASMRRLSALRERHPKLPVIGAISDASVSLVRMLVRQGISDVVALPLDINEVMQVSLEILANHECEVAASTRLAPMVAVVRSMGGCGSTTIATHLAADLAAHAPTGRGAVIADLDLQLGTAAHYLGVTARGDLSSLLDAGNRLDEELLRSVVVDAGNGLAVLAAPEAILPLETVDTDQLLRILELLRQQFDYVVLDLPTNWTNWTLSAVAAADAVVLVVELTIASLRQAQRRIELFNSVGIASDRVEVVVNRVEKRLFRTIDTGDVAKTLSHTVLGSITLDAPTVSAAQDQGRLIGDVARKSRFMGDIASIGEALRRGHLAGKN